MEMHTITFFNIELKYCGYDKENVYLKIKENVLYFKNFFFLNIFLDEKQSLEPNVLCIGREYTRLGP